MPSVLDYMDWVVAALLHHGFMIRLEKNKRQGVLPTMPPITVFGHDFGSTVAFELIRMLKKSESVYMPIHHFIASACRPPEVFCAFFLHPYYHIHLTNCIMITFCQGFIRI